MTLPDDQRLDLSAWRAPEPPAGLTDAVMALVPDAMRAGAAGAAAVEPTARAGSRARRAGTVAALAAAAAAAGLTWWLWPRPAEVRGGHVSAAGPSSLHLAGATDALVEAGTELDWRSGDGGVAVEQRRGTATYQHRDGTLTVTTPLGTVTSRRATFHVAIQLQEETMNSKLALAGGGAAAVAVAAVAITVYDGEADVRDQRGHERTVAAGSSATLTAPAPPAPPAPAVVTRTVKDRARRDEVAAAIARVRAARDAASAGGALPGGGGARPTPVPAPVAPAPGAPVDDTPGVLTRDEIRTGVREVVPMLADCYTLELARDPSLAGKVVAHLTVDAEPDLGTIVTMTDVELPPAFRATPDFRDCMMATLESVVLPPLSDGGHVEITYPFSFANNDGEDGPPPPAPPARTSDRRDPRGDRTRAPGPAVDRPANRLDPDAAGALRDPAALVLAAEAAAKRSEWREARDLALRVLSMRPDSSVELRAITVGVLAGCNVKDAATAQRLFPLLPPNRQLIVSQRCAQNGIEVEP